VKVVIPELLAISTFVLIGWAALWPSRTRLGAFAYHVAALPVGLLAGPLSLFVSSMTKRPLDAVSLAGGTILLIASMWVVQRLVLDSAQPGTPVGLRSYLVMAAAVLGVGALIGVLRVTATNYDSVSSFWPLGVQLSRKGAFNIVLASSRSTIIPTMNAIHVLFGSDWAYVIYPMLGLTLASWLGGAVWAGPLSGPGISVRTRRLVTGAAVLFLALEPSFLFNFIMVHSQMISAVYMLISVSAIWLGIRPDRDGVNPAFLIVAGIAAAGLGLSRPDGLVYAFVPIAAAISVLTISEVRWRDVTAFFAPMLFLIFAVYAAAYLRLGIWKSDKLGGKMMLAVMAVLALSAAGPWIVQALDRVVPFRVKGERFLGILLPVSAVLVAVVLAMKWSSAHVALMNAWANLFLGAGGYFYLWYAAVILMVLLLVSGDALRMKSWTRPAFFAVLLFLVIAELVHGTSHEGRIGAGDSFNRVAFEIVPVVIMLGAAAVARILSPAADAAEADTAGE
jgi:hypothetical protein